MPFWQLIAHLIHESHQASSGRISNVVRLPRDLAHEGGDRAASVDRGEVRLGQIRRDECFYRGGATQTVLVDGGGQNVEAACPRMIYRLFHQGMAILEMGIEAPVRQACGFHDVRDSNALVPGLANGARCDLHNTSVSSFFPSHRAVHPDGVFNMTFVIIHERCFRVNQVMQPTRIDGLDGRNRKKRFPLSAIGCEQSSIATTARECATMSEMTGSCMCGDVRFACEGQPALVAVCHCKTCQRQTGSSFSILAAFPREAMSLTAMPPASYDHVGDSGAPVSRKFCGKCGSPIYSDLGAIPQLLFIKAGTFDDATWLKPTHHYFCDSMQSWVQLDSESIKAARAG